MSFQELKSRFRAEFVEPASPRLVKQELLRNRIQLNRVDEPGKPRVYADSRGREYFSVTSILSEYEGFDKSYLTEWTKYVGAETAEISTQKAATRGTLVHEALESWIKREKYDPNFISNQLCIRLFKQCVAECNKRVYSFIGSEIKVKSSIGFSGTIDAFGYVWDDQIARLCPAIIDFKNYRSTKTHNDLIQAFYQVALYSIALEETYGFITDSAIIISSSESLNTAQSYFIDMVEFKKLKSEALSVAISVISKMKDKYGRNDI